MMVMYSIAVTGCVFGEDDGGLGWQKAQQLAEGEGGLFAQLWSGHLTQFSVFLGGLLRWRELSQLVGGEQTDSPYPHARRC